MIAFTEAMFICLTSKHALHGETRPGWNQVHRDIDMMEPNAPHDLERERAVTNMSVMSSEAV